MTKKITKSQGSSSKLTARQTRFVEEYLIDLNASQAAIRAGYSKKTAPFIGYENLNKPYIADIIEKALAERTKAAGLSVQWVLDKYKELVERCMQIIPVREKIDGEWVETGEFKFDSGGAIKALDSIAKYLGMFIDKHEVKLNVTGIDISFVKPKGDDG